MTRARSTRASWSAAAVVSPVVAALAAGSILWAASNNPLATAGESAAAPTVATAQVTSDQAAPAATDEQLSVEQLRKKAKKLQRAVEQARKEARAAREAGLVTAGAGASTWVPSTPSSGSNVQPAPAPAPAADTWTGSSGG